ncbi:sensor histidine kinase [Streptomyces albireticuli]|uniref:sensor histidine kinase n=1 Tax=Streptomyces albireticuli TaxID=1940 RepID=UPI001E62BED0|nr:HAMP domain-containing sensor histidine kinase [Streptomyces albireticuli]MCD9143965.1 HAMP domain-containing histidine kinase [Streptomyces albireticuli]MCD9161604.1 HAMP domain-containing histidine kinase [Streptomyces albireticuli]MCD9192082.1 HAMP domain-containing histidine kinase [Streptomyces albireticuli]
MRALRSRLLGRRPLRARLALVTSAAVAVVALGVLAAAYVVIRYELVRQLDLQLKQQASLIAAQQSRESPTTGTLYGECAWLAAPACAQVVRADPTAHPAGLVLPVTGATRRVAAGTLGEYYSDITLDGRAMRMFTTPVKDGRALQVAVRSDTVDKGVRQAGLLLGAVGGGGVLLAAGLGYFASRTSLRPVTRLTATAERIAATRDPAHRIELPPYEARRQDEITSLATSFNTMLGELEEAVAAQRRLVADASHELRTPLTALRTNAELLARAERLTPAQRERASGALGRQLREVTGLVNDLIELARDEEPQQLVERVRLDLLAERCVGEARGHWPNTPFVAELTEATVSGVPARLARLLSNLLDNAAKFSPPGAMVEVRLDRTADGLDLTVRDHGPGISTEDLPYVFDRFYRSRQARALPGSGLGLAMGRQIARAHGAELTAEQAAGGGARFRLRFPPE